MASKTGGHGEMALMDTFGEMWARNAYTRIPTRIPTRTRATDNGSRLFRSFGVNTDMYHPKAQSGSFSVVQKNFRFADDSLHNGRFCG
jgi:hypothetical protein